MLFPYLTWILNSHLKKGTVQRVSQNSFYYGQTWLIFFHSLSEGIFSKIWDNSYISPAFTNFKKLRLLKASKIIDFSYWSHMKINFGMFSYWYFVTDWMLS